MKTFKDIEFGEVSAENENALNPSLITNGYYNAHNWIELALESNKFLFLGVKGSGKSSLLSNIDNSKNYCRFTKLSNLHSFPFSNFTSSAFTGALGKERTLPKSWEWLLTFQLLWLFESDNSVIKNKHFCKLLNGLKDVGFNAPDRFDESVIQTRKSKNIIHGPSFDLSSILGDGVSLTTFKYETQASNQEKDIVFEKLVNYATNILLSCRSENKYYLMIDGLDRVLFSKGDYTPVASLIDESLRLNNLFYSNKAPFKIILVCRKDLFDKVPIYNANSIKQSYSIEMRWFSDARNHRDNHLVKLANFRSSNSLGRDVDIFEEYFNDKIIIDGENKSKTFLTLQYILYHTRNTPRDFLAALKFIQNAHVLKNDLKITAEEIIEGLTNYALDYFIEEIRDELSGYFEPTQIDIIFRILSSSGVNRFSSSSAIGMLTDEGFTNESAIEVLNILFDCSAIGQLSNKEGKVCNV